jgi:hypothetical protein
MEKENVKPFAAQAIIEKKGMSIVHDQRHGNPRAISHRRECGVRNCFSPRARL